MENRISPTGLLNLLFKINGKYIFLIFYLELMLLSFLKIATQIICYQYQYTKVVNKVVET